MLGQGLFGDVEGLLAELLETIPATGWEHLPFGFFDAVVTIKTINMR